MFTILADAMIPAASHPTPGPEFETLMFVGATSVSVMLLAWLQERQSRHWALVRAVACVVAAAYGFLQGAWPLGIAAIAWAVSAVVKWRTARRPRTSPRMAKPAPTDAREREILMESRLSRMFGPL
jgi:hypothetical protein